MTDQHPITPPPDLVEKWLEEADTFRYLVKQVHQYVAGRAAKWGADQANADIERKLQEAADQELEACCEWLKSEGHEHEHEALFAARRPKPPSLKEQALMALEDGDTGPGASLTLTEVSIIRRALEALPDD